MRFGSRPQRQPGTAPSLASGSGGGSCTLRDLCPEDKAKVAKLIKQVVDLGGENQRLKDSHHHQQQRDEGAGSADEQAAERDARLRQLQETNKQVIGHNIALKAKLGQLLQLLRMYQHKVQVLEAAAKASAVHLAGAEAGEQRGAGVQPQLQQPEQQQQQQPEQQHADQPRQPEDQQQPHDQQPPQEQRQAQPEQQEQAQQEGLSQQDPLPPPQQHQQQAHAPSQQQAAPSVSPADVMPVLVEAAPQHAADGSLVAGLLRWQVQHGVAAPEQLSSAGAKVLQFDPSIGQHGAFFLTDAPLPILSATTPGGSHPASVPTPLAAAPPAIMVASTAVTEAPAEISEDPDAYEESVISQLTVSDAPPPRCVSGWAERPLPVPRPAPHDNSHQRASEWGPAPSAAAPAAHPALARVRRQNPGGAPAGGGVWGSPTRRQLLNLANSLDALATRGSNSDGGAGVPRAPLRTVHQNGPQQQQQQQQQQWEAVGSKPGYSALQQELAGSPPAGSWAAGVPCQGPALPPVQGHIQAVAWGMPLNAASWEQQQQQQQDPRLQPHEWGSEGATLSSQPLPFSPNGGEPWNPQHHHHQQQQHHHQHNPNQHQLQWARQGMDQGGRPPVPSLITSSPAGGAGCGGGYNSSGVYNSSCGLDQRFDDSLLDLLAEVEQLELRRDGGVGAGGSGAPWGVAAAGVSAGSSRSSGGGGAWCAGPSGSRDVGYAAPGGASAVGGPGGAMQAVAWFGGSGLDAHAGPPPLAQTPSLHGYEDCCDDDDIVSSILNSP